MIPTKKNQTTKSSRKRSTLRGKGDYSNEINNLKDPIERLEKKLDHLEKNLVHKVATKKNAAEVIGRTLGNFANQGDLGALAGSTLAKYFGHGDYSLHKNSLMDGKHLAGAKFSSDGKRGTRIIEREFIGDVSSGILVGNSTEFTNGAFIINPTDSRTFPWLSRLAHLYDQWEPNGIVFEFVSTSSEYNGTSQALGTIVMATDYDPYDQLYINKQVMENADYACSTKPANGLLHGIECDTKERPTALLYTDTTNGSPLTSTQLGRFQLATQGCSVGGVTLGELWISYDITFYKKQLIDSTIINLPFLTQEATTSTGTGYFAGAPNDSYQISIYQIIGTGSRIDFNNIAAGSVYLVNYFLLNPTATDESNVRTTFTVNNGAFDSRGSFDLGIDSLMVWVVTTTSANTSLQTTINTDGAKQYSLSVTQVTPDYTF